MGEAEAAVIQQKIASMESGNYAIVQVARALAAGGVRLVPDVLVNGGAKGEGGTLVDVLLAVLVRERHVAAPTQVEAAARAVAGAAAMPLPKA